MQTSLLEQILTQPEPILSKDKGSKKVKTGVFAGSFNPPHVGHLNIIQKAEKIFDNIVVLQAWNPAKNMPAYPIYQ
jgi:cytidyltransferase-like protein